MMYKDTRMFGGKKFYLYFHGMAKRGVKAYVQVLKEGRGMHVRTVKGPTGYNIYGSKKPKYGKPDLSFRGGDD